MAISLIIGKPGSGKSYYAVSKIADQLCDFARYEQRNQQPAEGGFWTNLHLNFEECDKYVKNNTSIKFDSSRYLHLLEDSFFYEEDGKTPREWWEDIPIEQTIVIDEVHQYIPSHGTGDRNYMERFTKYISQHRHYKHEIWLITQHTDTIHKNILCMAESAYHVTNVKTRIIPFLGIPFADLDVVKEAWGCRRQIANIIFGNYLGRSFKKESLFSIVLKPEIYALYVSHMYTKGAEGDKASLHLGRFQSIIWLLRRHFFQLSVKAFICVITFYSIRYLLSDAPNVLSKSLVPALKESQDKNLTSSSSEALDRLRSDSVIKRTPREGPETVKFSGVYVYGKDFIITERGRVEPGENFFYYGEKKKLLSVDFLRRVVDVDDVVDSADVVDGVSASDGSGS